MLTRRIAILFVPMMVAGAVGSCNETKTPAALDGGVGWEVLEATHDLAQAEALSRKRP